jgi:hypothetical protein
VPWSIRRIAARLGVDKKEIANAREHVAAVELCSEWESLSSSEAMNLAATLPKLPEAERAVLVMN